MNRLTWLNMQAPGEMLVTVGKDSHGLWEADVFSNFELNQKSDGVWFRWRGDEELQWQQDLPPTTAVYRIWRPKPRLRDAPDSPLRSVETECKELVLLKLSIMARITSRLVSQGILFIPNNIELAGGAPQVEGLKNDSLGQVLYQMFTAMLANPGSSASAMPILLRGDPDAGEKIRHVVLETDIAETEMRYRQELRDAIANGIELPQQTQTTTQSEVHHWGMWAIDERALSGHVVPVIRMLTHEFTVNLLWPSLRATGMSEREVRLWEIGVDPTRAALAANQTDQAMQLYEHGLIGGDIVRRAFGFSEADAMVGNELLRWIGVKVNNPMLSSWGIDGFPAEMLDQAPKGPGPGGFNAAPPKANGSQQVGSQAKGLDGS